MLIADGVADVGMPPDGVAGLDFRDRNHAGHQLLVPLGTDAESAAGPGSTEIVFRDVVLQRAQEHIGNAVGDWDEPQRPVARSLPRQRRPTLIGAEHAADGGRGDLRRL